MKKVSYFQRTCMLVVMLTTLSVFTLSAKKVKLSATSTFYSDLSNVPTPDSTLAGFTTFADGKALIKVFTNDTGLNIQLTAKDETTQQKWLFNGLTIYVDPTGKGSDKYAMVFPSLMSLGRPDMMRQSQQTDNPTPQTGQRPPFQGPDMQMMAQRINSTGATFDVNGDTIFAGPSLAEVTLINPHQLCYNIKLPYSIFHKQNLNPEHLSIGIVSEFKFPQRQGDNRGNMGGPGGGMGGPGGDMGGPGMGGPGMGPGGMGGPGGMNGFGPGMSGGQRNKSDRFSDMQQPVKGWIEITVAQH
ncbi:hypothetical protein [Microbacter margulisiae]|uniref:Uncharacterized protein n=1 Tax=Microbacter margulisiae TaxID=1350067 RepID=A0A7W5H187_9PORP|nr:hypothetical protein [Microbacter margulisiae]MBB3186379.1 hypothetical protein [Microbacter margulisiae]